MSHFKQKRSRVPHCADDEEHGVVAEGTSRNSEQAQRPPRGLNTGGRIPRIFCNTYSTRDLPTHIPVEGMSRTLLQPQRRAQGLNPGGKVPRVFHRVRSMANVSSQQPAQDVQPPTTAAPPQEVRQDLLVAAFDFELVQHEQDFMDGPDCGRDSHWAHNGCEQRLRQPQMLFEFDQDQLQRYGHMMRLYHYAEQNREAAVLVQRRVKLYLQDLNRRHNATTRRIQSMRYGPARRAEVDRQARMFWIRSCVEKLDFQHLVPPIRLSSLITYVMLTRDITRAILIRTISNALNAHEHGHGHEECWDLADGQPDPFHVSWRREIKQLCDIGRMNLYTRALLQQEIVAYLRRLDMRLDQLRARLSTHPGDEQLSGLILKLTKDKICVAEFMVREDWSNVVPLGAMAPLPYVVPKDMRWTILTLNIDRDLREHETISDVHRDHKPCWQVVRGENVESHLVSGARYCYIRRLRDAASYPGDEVLLRQRINAWIEDVDGRVEVMTRALEASNARGSERDRLERERRPALCARRCVAKIRMQRDGQGQLHFVPR